MERNWIEYADGTFEPVRRDGSISRKWSDERTDFKWWTTLKPADWMPWDHGHGFSWNHDFGEENKPADWGLKDFREAGAGRAPYFMAGDFDAEGRMESRIERIDGRREVWEYQYDDDGRLTGVLANTGWAEDYDYDDKGRRSADYMVGREPFMRSLTYDDNDRLLAVNDTRYAHDENGQRSMKLVNGQPVEAYDWLDFIRLGRFFDGRNEYVFHYDDDHRLPHGMTVNERRYSLEYDQVGSLKAVVDDIGHVVKMRQYDAFGILLWDTSPACASPSALPEGCMTRIPASSASAGATTTRTPAAGPPRTPSGTQAATRTDSPRPGAHPFGASVKNRRPNPLSCGFVVRLLSG